MKKKILLFTKLHITSKENTETFSISTARVTHFSEYRISSICGQFSISRVCRPHCLKNAQLNRFQCVCYCENKQS